ncbi:hypothetical protein JR334_03140 [Clostridia bacterium]|nr:hypothetical protein JR334_03140 [Clostridia bacterium]
MFPLTHLYVNQIILGSMNPARAIGSVLPDLLVYNGIDWEDAHSIKKKFMLPRDVFLADALHGVALPGLDYYTDKSYRNGNGFAFYKAGHIKEDLSSLGVPERDCLWRGHNVIEMAVEVNIKRFTRMTFEPMRHAIEQTDLLHTLEQSLSDSIGHDIDLTTPLSLFVSLDGDQNILSKHYSQKLNAFYETEISGPIVSRLIDKAQTHIEKDYTDFLEYCVTRMEKDLRVLERGISC